METTSRWQLFIRSMKYLKKRWMTYVVAGCIVSSFDLVFTVLAAFSLQGFADAIVYRDMNLLVRSIAIFAILIVFFLFFSLLQILHLIRLWKSVCLN